MTLPQHVSLRALAARLGISVDHLKRVAGRAGAPYAPFGVKTAPDKAREIDNPVGELKDLQRRIAHRLLSTVPLGAHVHGGVRGRSPETNALPHVESKHLVTIDIRDFFPRVTNRQVFGAFRRLGYGTTAASVLTKLTTRERRLPLGAPTSTALGNLVLAPVDASILRLLQYSAVRYTRFVDDLALSGDHPERFIPAIANILGRAGFPISRKKVKVFRDGKFVTGYVLHRGGLSVRRTWRDSVRRQIHALRYTASDHTERQVASIRGKIAHVRRWNPGAANRLNHQLEATLLDQQGPQGL